MKQRFLSLVLIAVFLSALFCGCSKNSDNGSNNKEYLGDYSYSAPAVCMVYEPVEGETDDNGDPFYGIQYREITDLNGFLASGNTLLLYFYSSMDNRGAEITAAVEDLAQIYNGRLSVLMLDAVEYKEMLEKYGINAVPEFVLIKSGQSDSIFGSTSYDYWTMSDVVLWLKSNGIN